MSSDPGVFPRPESDDSLSTLQRQAGCHDTECSPAGRAGEICPHGYGNVWCILAFTPIPHEIAKRVIKRSCVST